MTSRRVIALAAIVALAGVAGTGALLAQGGITATVKGRVVDTDGAGLPGVIVQIKSTSQPSGNKQVPTDIEGNYRIPLLPPANDYTIRIDYPGFAPIEVGPLDLDPGKATVQNITLRSDAETTETIVVESKGNIVDTESTKVASTYNAEFIEGLPIIGSNYQDILTLAPGVTDTDGDGNPNVHGARDTGLQYRLDGGNITDPASGTFGQNLNSDIIEELEVITSGASAEFGRADGGFANIITKSGGNDFEGRFSVRYRSYFLNGNFIQNDVNTYDDQIPSYHDVRPVLSLGGAVVKDKLWYFGSLQIIDAERPNAQVGNPRLQTFSGHNGFAKLTWQANSYNKLAFQVNTDPLKFDGNNIALGTAPESDFSFDQGGVSPQIKWTSTISPQLLLESQVAIFNSGIAITPVSDNFSPTETRYVTTGANVIQTLYPCTTINCIADPFTYVTDLVDGTINGPFRFKTDDERTRNSIKTDLSYNVEDALGQHNIKSGIEFADEKFEDDPIFNPFLVDVTMPFSNTVTGGTGGTTDPRAVTGIQQLTTFRPLVTHQEAESFNSSIYALDSWKPLPNLTVNLGIRVDRENIDTSGFGEFDPREERKAAIQRWTAICYEVSRQISTNQNMNCHEATLADGSPNPAWLATYNGLNPTGIPRGVIHTFRDDNLDGINDIDPLVSEMDLNGDGIWDNQDGNSPQNEAFQQFKDFTLFTERETENFSIENTNVAPRVSLSWDPWADGKTKLFGSWGRFFDRLFLNTVTGEIGPDSVNFAFVPNSQTHLIVPGQASRASSTVSVTQIDRGLETPYTDEWTLGVERELAPEWSLSLSYINRTARDLLQDKDINHLTCEQYTTIGIDPMVVCGDGGVLETDRFGASTTISTAVAAGGDVTGGDFQSLTLGFRIPNGAPDLYTVNNGFNQILRIGNFNSSDYESYEIKLVKRLHRNWQMQFSYTWSEAFGQAANFADASGNDPQTVDDEEGYLDFDQRHVLKFQAVTRLPHEIQLGTSIQWASGVPWSETKTVVDVDSTGNTIFRSFFPTGQRNDQRNGGWWKLDGRIEKNFVIGRVQAAAFLAAENLLDDHYLTISDLDIRALDGIPLTAAYDIGRRFEVGAVFNF